MPKQKTEQKGVTVAVVHRLIWLREQIATGERENYCTTDGKCLKFEDDDVDEGDGPSNSNLQRRCPFRILAQQRDRRLTKHVLVRGQQFRDSK